MRTKQQLYQDAMRTVAARRQTARARADDAISEAIAAAPGFAQAEEEYRRCGVQAALCGASGQSSTAAILALRQAKLRRDAALAASGRGPNSLEPRYACPLCQDTGQRDGHVCACVQALMRQMRREEIEQNSSLRIQSFDDMCADYYPEKKDDISGRTIRSVMKHVLEDLRAYADGFDRGSVDLFLYGDAGLGKSHAALAIAGEVLQKGYDVLYLSSPEFFGRLEELYYSFDDSGERELLMEAAQTADLLILDDLGTENNTNFMISAFYTLLNARTAHRLPTVYTTNITSVEMLEKRYTQKISSRLWGSCEPFHFLGEDIRLKKAAEV